MPLSPKTLMSGRNGAWRCAALLAALTLGAACSMQPSYSAKVTSADGVTVEVPLSETVQATDGVVTVRYFQFVPLKTATGETKNLGYAYALYFIPGAVPVSLVLDDDTDDPIINLQTMDSPKVGDKGIFKGITDGFSPMESRANWISTLDSGIRVYRFTIKLADGSVHVLREPIFVPANAKVMLRVVLGVKEP